MFWTPLTELRGSWTPRADANLVAAGPVGTVRILLHPWTPRTDAASFSGISASDPTGAVRPTGQGGRDLVELVADGTGDLRAGEHHHQADNGCDQYVLDKSLPTEAGRLRSDPPRGENAAVCICGSLRSGFAIRAERRAIPKGCAGLAAAATMTAGERTMCPVRAAPEPRDETHAAEGGGIQPRPSRSRPRDGALSPRRISIAPYRPG